jgi:hypothetical protein
MQLEVRLLHCDAGRRVVLVSAREGERFLGSALGEAGNAEEAEDRARARLLASLEPAAGARPARPAPAQRPGKGEPVAPAGLSPPPSAAPTSAPAPILAPQDGTPELPPDPRDEDPQDWSPELTRLDLQMRRLGWDREREAIYLQRCFGHPSRDRITVFADLMTYLQAIEALEPGSDPAIAAVPLRRGDLLQQCDLLLQQLGWDGSRGRSFLEQQLGVSSRQQLKDADLLRFNMLLEEQTLQASSGRSTA